jgi:hypothetical protein
MPHYGIPMGMPDLLAPCRRASMLMFVLGGLGLLMGGCLALMPVALRNSSDPQVQLQVDILRTQMQENTHLSPDAAFQMITIAGAMMMAAALVMLILGFFVRRGGRIASVLSCILVALMFAMMLPGTAGSLAHPGPQMLAGLCMCAAILGSLGLLFVWLITAFRAAGNLALAKQQYAAQYWQYQQNMQAYGYAQQQQAQLGYPTAPPTPPLQNPNPPV